MREGVKLTDKMISNFAEDLQNRGRSAATIRLYRKALTLLARFLQPEGLLCRESLLQWREAMRDGGAISANTINLRVSAANSLLQSIGHLEWTLPDQLSGPIAPEQTLSNREYFQLLHMAKAEDKEEIYYIIKTLRGTGVRACELQRITVELVRAGRGQWRAGDVWHSTFITEPLRRELLAYAERNGIIGGPVFLNGKGRPIDRSVLYGQIKRIADEAGLAPGKATPRNLEKLYRETYESLATAFSVLLEQAYGRILEEEDRVAGWER